MSLRDLLRGKTGASRVIHEPEDLPALAGLSGFGENFGGNLSSYFLKSEDKVVSSDYLLSALGGDCVKSTKDMSFKQSIYSLCFRRATPFHVKDHPGFFNISYHLSSEDKYV